MSLSIQFKKLSPEAKSPSKAHPTDAGFDVFSNEYITIGPLSWAKVPLGIAVAIPPGYCLVAKDKSGLALKNGIHIMAGVIDTNYRGEVCAIVANGGNTEFKVEKGMKITQMLVLPVPQVTFEEVENLDETDRGSGGFGSSGLF